MTGWHIIIPVKRLGAAKSRIPLSAALRADLVLAMLDDVVASARLAPSVDAVHVVSADAVVGERARLCGAAVIVGDEVHGLNGDLATAISSVRADHRDAAIAIVVADLPCLAAGDLEHLLAQAPTSGPAFVAGVDGGTTMLLARAAVELAPRFGSHSAWNHAQDAERLSDVPASARIDIDSLDALQSAVQQGVGPQTLQWIRHCSPVTTAI